MFIIRIYLEILCWSFLVARQFQNNLLTWNTVFWKLKLKNHPYFLQWTNTLFWNVNYSQNKLPSSEHIISNLIYTKLNFCLWALPFFFPFRLLSHENLWGFGFPSQLGTGHFFWNLVFPQDGKTICYSACMYNDTALKTGAFLLLGQTSISQARCSPSPCPRAWLWCFPPFLMTASQ